MLPVSFNFENVFEMLSLNEFDMVIIRFGKIIRDI